MKKAKSIIVKGEAITVEGKQGERGPEGRQGATGVYDSDTQTFLTTIETATGTSQTKTMTQKAITDELDAVNVALSLTSIHVDTDFTNGCQNVSSTDGQISNTNSANRYATEVALDRSIYEVNFRAIKYTSNYGYAFVDGEGTIVGTGVKTTANEDRTIGRSELLAAIEGGATTLRLGHYDKATEPVGFTVKKFVSGKVLADLSDDVSDLSGAVNFASYHVDTDIANGHRNVSSEDGSYSTTSSGDKFANELTVDETLYEVTYPSAGFDGNFGYAFLNGTTFVSGVKVTTQGTVTINRATILAAIAGGANKLRISVRDNASSPVGFTIKKTSVGEHFDAIESKVSALASTVATVEPRITALESIPRHYKVLGSPVPYIVDSIGDDDIEGLSVFTSLNDLYDAYDALVTAHPGWFAKEDDLGKDESDTYYIRHYTLRYQHPTINTQRDLSGSDVWSDSTFKPRRIIINMGVHPNEKFSMLGGYLAIKEILESNEPWAQFIKSNFILDIVPCLNPYGLENDQKENVNNFNLNRTYFNDIQAENQCMIDLIQALKPIGLVGTIDLHNNAQSRGYLVSKHTYKLWNYYGILAQQIAALMHNLMASVYGERDVQFFLWRSTDDGQLHEYADSQGLLGCSFELPTSLPSNPDRQLKGSVLSKIVCINLINAFGTYE